MKKNLLNYFVAGCRILLCALPGSVVFQPLSGQTYTFTTCGATGQFGPNQGQVNAAYTGTNPLNGQVTVTGQGIQNWTVPGTGLYRIAVYGASGGAAGSYAHFGRGASMEGDFNLTGGQVLKILVGQMGAQGTNGGCGGGGTFIADNANTPLIVAGGGSGGGNYTNPTFSIMDARTTNYGASYQSTGRATAGGGGGSFLVSGLNANGGQSFIAGGAGGAGSNGVGGFGGGGGSGGANQYAAGGGGYSGGDEIHGTNIYQGQEGGGGSYNAGTNQVNASGVNTGHGYAVITRMCDVSAFALTNPICEGAAVTLSTNAGSSILWSHGPTTASVSVSPQTTTSYTVSGVSSSTSACASTVVVTVFVNPLPDVTAVAFPQLVCEGGEAELTAGGAASYTWTGGPSAATMTASPQSTSVYTVTGESIHGCINTQTVEVTVSTNAITLPPTATVCAGGEATLVASGVVSHTWSTGSNFGSIVVSPGTNTVYTVSGHDPNGCKLNAMVSVNVASGPAVSITGNQQVCRGEPATLIASGADSYFWNTNETTETITQVLLVDVPHSFTVTGTGANGCSTTDVFTVLVSKCQALIEEGLERIGLFPNPSDGHVALSGISGTEVKVRVTDITGKIVFEKEISGSEPALNLSGLDKGLYSMTVISGNDSRTVKLILE